MKRRNRVRILQTLTQESGDMKCKKIKREERLVTSNTRFTWFMLKIFSNICTYVIDFGSFGVPHWKKRRK